MAFSLDQYFMGAPTMPQPAQQPAQADPSSGLLNQILTEYQKKQQQNGDGIIQSILSGRFQPNSDDAARSITQTAQSYGAPELFRPITPEQQANARMANELAPFMQTLKISGDQSDASLKNAQAGYYGSALQRDLAEKAYQYANDPQMAQAKMMAKYMSSLGGGQGGNPMPANASPTDIPPINASDLQPSTGIQISGPAPNPPTPQNLSQVMQQNAQPAQSAPAAQGGGGFNPMGAMLAKSLGLTDMQIGANGQPMPIPGSMKVEGGSVISFDKNGQPQSNIPVNPRAQGLFEQKLKDIHDNVNKLHALGSTIEEGDSWLSNMANQAASNPWTGLPTIEQGSKAQTLRDNISADVKQALPLYMQAFGITPGMERAQAAQQMLQDAIGGSLTKSRQHTLANLRNLSQTAGTGELAKQLSRVNVISPDGQQGSIAPEELQAAMANGWKQVQ